MKTPINYLRMIEIELEYTWFSRASSPITILRKMLNAYMVLHRSRCVSNLHHIKLMEKVTDSNMTVEGFCHEVNKLTPYYINNDGEFARLLRAYFQIYPYYLALIKGHLIIHLSLETPCTTLCISRGFFQGGDKASIANSLARNPLESSGSFSQNNAAKELLHFLSSKNYETHMAASESLKEFARHKTYVYKRELIKTLIELPHVKDKTDDIYIITAVEIARLIPAENKNEFVKFLLTFFTPPRDKCNWDLPAILLEMFKENFPVEDRKNLVNTLILKAHPNNFHAKAVLALRVLKDHIDDATRQKFTTQSAEFIEREKRNLLYETLIISSQSNLTISSNSIAYLLNSSIRDPSYTETAIKTIDLLSAWFTEALMHAYIQFILSLQGRTPRRAIKTIIKKIDLVTNEQCLALFRRFVSEYKTTTTTDDRVTADGISATFKHLSVAVKHSETIRMFENIDISEPNHAILNTFGLITPKYPTHAILEIVDKLVSFLSRNRAASHVITKNLDRIAARLNDANSGEVCELLCTIYKANQTPSRMQIIPVLTRYMKFVPADIVKDMMKSLRDNLDCAWFSYHISDIGKCDAIDNFVRGVELEIDVKSIFARFLIKCMFDEPEFELRDRARNTFDTLLSVTVEKTAKDYLLPHLFMRYKTYLQQEFTYDNVTLEMEKYCRMIRNDDIYVRAIRKHVLPALAAELQDKIIDCVSTVNRRYQHQYT